MDRQQKDTKFQTTEILSSLYLLASEDLLDSKMTEAGVMWRPLRQQVSGQGP